MIKHEKLILEIIEKYEAYGACLGGSRMLELRGIKVDREPHDIDIIVRQQIELTNDDSIECSNTEEHTTLKIKGIIVDFLLEKEPYFIEEINGIPCVDLQSLINAKKRYNTEKHNEDLKLILKIMDAKKIKELAEKVETTEYQVNAKVMKVDKIEFGEVDLRLEYNDTYDRSSRLKAICCRIIKENSTMIIEEAKLRMNKQLIEQTEELKRATLEYATGFKVN